MNLSALSSANFRTYFIGNAFALNATWMNRVITGWIAWDMTGAAGFVGLVSLVQFLPTVFLSPLFGVWVDRIDVRRLAMFTQSCMLLSTLALFACAATGVLDPVVLVGLTGLTGTIVALHHPIRMSMAPRLVDRALVGSVVNLTSINFNLARTIGPAIGGFAIAVLGVASALFVQALFYVPFILAIRRLEIRARSGNGAAQERFVPAFLSGLRHVRGSPLVREAMLLAGAMTLVVRGALEILPVVADGVFGQGASGLGLLTSCAGIGAVLAGFAKAVLPPQSSGRLPGSALAAALAGMAMVPALGLAPTLGVALVVVGAMGFVSTITAVSLQTAIQLDLDDDMRGRVMSLWIVVAMGGASAGAGLLGILVDLAGFGPAMVTAGVSALVAVVGVARVIRK